MTEAVLLKGYETLRREHDLPPLTQSRLYMAPPRFFAPEAAAGEIRNYALQAGWLRYQSRLRWFGPGLTEVALPIERAGDGWPLYGEFIAESGGKSCSLHLRPDGKGSLRLTEFRVGEGDACFAQEVRLLGEGVVAVRYEVFWQTWEHGMRQIAARFLGFVSE